MSEGKHRAPKPSKPSALRRLAVTVGLAAAATTVAVATDALTATKSDSGWGAPDTTTDTGWGTPGDDGGIVTTNGDSGWG